MLKPTLWNRFLRGVLYFCQVGLGYLAMLVAMTYSTLLFFVILFGFSTGHVLFNINQPVPENAEPCCVGMEEDESESAFLPLSSS